MARVLLLAGTGHARRLAADLIAAGHDVTASLAGATKDPAAYPCPSRVGGFGGPTGLASHLQATDPDALIDATHPFAAQISDNARKAAAITGTTLLRLARPEWKPEQGEKWQSVATLEAAAAALPPGARAFLATGRKSLSAFQHRSDIWCALRQVDPPKAPFPGNGKFIIARPPFDTASETKLFASLVITHLVAKNAGGTEARTKLTAAATLGIPIIMVQRPDEGTFQTHTTAEILACLAQA